MSSVVPPANPTGKSAETPGDRLRAARRAANLSQEELAARAGIGARTVQALESGSSRLPQPLNRKRIGDALGLDAAGTNALFFGAAPEVSLSRTASLALASPPALIGRQQELAVIDALLADPRVRLLTLTGPGGVGKTSLLKTVVAAGAGDPARPVVSVSLAEVADPHDMLGVIAAALEVPEQRDDPRAIIVNAARGRRLALALDNLEHLLEAMPLLAGLLSDLPGLTIVATSREALRIGGETVLVVEPLPAARPNDPAIELFRQLAVLARPGRPFDARETAAIQQLCQRLDGLPLAIELAAAQMDIFTPETLLAMMDQAGLDALAEGDRGGPGRLSSMSAAIGWSWRQLDPVQQLVLRAAAVFTGGFDADGLTTVTGCIDPGPAGPSATGALSRLARMHLIRAIASDGSPRFTMLETIRLFALDRLRESGREQDARDAHARWAADRSRLLFDRTNAPDPAEASRAMAALDCDYANLRSAMDWALATRDATGMLSLTRGLVLLGSIRPSLEECQRRIDELLAIEHELPPLAAAIARRYACEIAFRRGDFARSRRLAERQIVAAPALDAPNDALCLADGLLTLSLLAATEGDGPTARDLAERAYAAMPEGADWTRPFYQGWARCRIGIELHRAGELDLAREWLEASLAIHLAEGHRPRAAMTQAHLGAVLDDLGQPRAAAALLLAALGTQTPHLQHWHRFHMARWLLDVAASHRDDPRIGPICDDLESALAADRDRAGFELPASASPLRRTPDAPAQPLSLDEATRRAGSLAGLLPESVAARDTPRPPMPPLV